MDNLCVLKHHDEVLIGPARDGWIADRAISGLGCAKPRLNPLHVGTARGNLKPFTAWCVPEHNR